MRAFACAKLRLQVRSGTDLPGGRWASPQTIHHTTIFFFSLTYPALRTPELVQPALADGAGPGNVRLSVGNVVAARQPANVTK